MRSVSHRGPSLAFLNFAAPRLWCAGRPQVKKTGVRILKRFAGVEFCQAGVCRNLTWKLGRGPQTSIARPLPLGELVPVILTNSLGPWPGFDFLTTDRTNF